MASKPRTRRRLNMTASAVIATAATTFLTWQVTGSDTDTGYVVSAALLMWSAIFDLVNRLLTPSPVIHRCPRRDCSFKVSMQGLDAGETRRWQEIAAAHPHKYTPTLH